MAVALDLIYTVSDDDGDKATTAISLPNGFSLAQYTEFVAAHAPLLDNFLEGKIDSADLCLTADLSALTSNLMSESNIEEIASFSFVTVEGRKVNVNVPTMREDMVAADSDDIDQGNPEAAAIIDMMLNGIVTTGGTIIPTDVGEDDVLSLVYARERFRSSGSRG